MTVLVCGGRDYADKDALFAVLNAIHAETPIVRLVHGAARGADSLGATWALFKGVFSAGYPANWTKYKKAAGFIRNQEMLDFEEVALVVACPGGRGTADMVRRAVKAGVRVVHVAPSPPVLTDAVIDAFLDTLQLSENPADPERVERIRTLFNNKLRDD